MRRRLILVAVATTSMVALAFLIPLGLLVRNVARDRALTDAERDVQRLAALLALAADADEAVELFDTGGSAAASDRVTLYLPGGDQLGVPGPPASDPSVRLARQGRAFTTPVDGGVALLSPVVLGDGRRAVVRTFVPESELEEGVARSWLALGAVGITLVLVAVAVADRLAASMVRPVRQLADAARRLGAGDLDVRVEPAGPPEVAEVAGAFNLLAGRVNELLAAERELVADLSHRLRTPLTALRLDADRVGDDPEAPARVAADVEALERTVDDLIREARRPIRDDVVAPTDLSDVVRERTDFWAPLAEEQGREWECRCPGTARPVRLARGDLEAAVDALLGNVFAHTPEGTPYWVEVAGDGEGVTCLVVEDAGPGLPDGDIVARGRSGGGSTGLGLDIVRRTAEAAGGRLVLAGRRGGGARIEVELPRA